MIKDGEASGRSSSIKKSLNAGDLANLQWKIVGALDSRCGVPELLVED
ncbi:hypothetical protein [Micromonospora chersina]